MQSVFRTLAAEYFSPLHIASYLALTAVWIGIVGAFGLRGEGLGTASVVLLGVFTLAWLARLRGDFSQPSWQHELVLIVLTLSALGLIGLGRSSVSPILLILLATLLAVRFPGSRIFLVLAVINLSLAGLMHWRWQLDWPSILVTISAYGAFQLFAVLLMHSSRRAEAMAEDLRAVNAHLLTTRYLLDAAVRDQERLRLSRELHDVAGHKLTALKLNLRQLQRDEALKQKPELEQAGQLANELLGDIRGVVRQLRAGDGIDLEHGLIQLAQRFPRPRLELELPADFQIRRADQAEALLRLVQEALTNAARHSQAQHLWVRLREQGDALLLELEDDGAARWPIQPGSGLSGMRERIESLDGTFSMAASPSGGLSIRASLPKLASA